MTRLTNEEQRLLVLGYEIELKQVRADKELLEESIELELEVNRQTRKLLTEYEMVIDSLNLHKDKLKKALQECEDYAGYTHPEVNIKAVVARVLKEIE